jgi:hypothetical protein
MPEAINFVDGRRQLYWTPCDASYVQSCTGFHDFSNIFLFLDAGGVITLTDAYVRVNRARGLELLSAEDMLNACENLEAAGDSNMRLHTYDTTGVKVL